MNRLDLMHSQGVFLITPSSVQRSNIFSIVCSAWKCTRMLPNGKSEIDSLLDYFACKNYDSDSANSRCERFASVESTLLLRPLPPHHPFCHHPWTSFS